MTKKETKIFYPISQTEWRKWLIKNHVIEQSVWLVFYKKSSIKCSISWSEAVDEALCFGWIDSKKIKIDEECSHQFFSKRKATSTWSKVNKNKIDKLIESGLMTNSGIKCIDIAKQNGSWIILDEVEELIIPYDLESAFSMKINSKEYFLSLSKSIRKQILSWLVFAKTKETREKRIKEIVESSAQNIKPKQIR